MRVLLRNRKSNAFITAAGTWQRDMQAARDFGSSAVAVQFAVERWLEDAEVLLCFDDACYDIVLPLHVAGTEWRRQPPAMGA